MATIGQLLISLEARSDKLEKELAKARRDLSRTQREMGRVGDAATRTERVVTRSFSRMSLGASGFTTRIVATSRHLQALAVAATAAIATSFISRTISATDALGKMADRLGVSVEGLQELRFAASQSGIAQERLEMAIQRFGRRAAEAAKGTGEARAVLQELNIALTDSHGRLRPVESLLLDVADRWGQMTSQIDRNRVAMKLFDSEGVVMTNLLRLGSQGILNLTQQARSLGLVIDEQMVRNSEAANDQLNIMQRIISAQLTRAIVSLAPTITRFGNGFARVVQAWNEGSAALKRLTPLERQFADLLIDISDTVSELIVAFGNLDDVVRTFFFGDWQNSSFFKTLQAIRENPFVRKILFGETLGSSAKAEREVAFLQGRLENLRREMGTRQPSVVEAGVIASINQQLETAQMQVEEFRRLNAQLNAPRRAIALPGMRVSAFGTGGRGIRPAAPTPLAPAGFLDEVARQTDQSTEMERQLANERVKLAQQVSAAWRKAAQDINREVTSSLSSLRSMGESLREQFRTPRETLEETRQQLQQIRDIMGPEWETTFQRASRAAERAFQQTTIAGQILEQGIQSVMDGIQISIEGVIAGTQSLEQAWRNMMQSIGLSLSSSLIRSGLSALGGVLTGGLGGLFGGGNTNLLGGGAFQHGGMVTRPTLALLGENPAMNPEFVLNRRQFSSLAGGRQQASEVNLIVVADRQEAMTRQAALLAENRRATIVDITNEILGGDGKPLNRAIRMVHRR